MAGKRITRIIVGLSIALGSAGLSASGQSIGDGASPGRAAYRPSAQWNNGPFYTVSHINPYASFKPSSTNLYESDPTAITFSIRPRGLYRDATPGRAALAPYVEGFSPYSNFAGWYQRTYGVVPTREVLQRARVMFFRSAPVPPAGTLPPLPPPTVVATPAAVNAPQRPAAAAPASRTIIPIHRSSVSGTS